LKILIALVLAALFLPALGIAQPSWKRQETKTDTKVELFHGTMTANFPTTESLKKGDFMYEISHRFVPPIKDGYDVYWGIDGPARIRTALSYGISDGVMVTLGRSNLMDNTDLRVKVKLFQFANPTLPAAFSLRAGIALNTGDIPESLDRNKLSGDNMQYYGQLIANTMLFNKKLGIGVVPSYLYNSSVFTVEKQYTFTLGNYYQYYFNDMWSVWVEYNPIVAGYQGFVESSEVGQKSYNSLSYGFDIETGGHFFHIVVTNNDRLNPSQYLVGANRSASSGDWRLGFGITRYL